MRKEQFDELIDSVREGGAILRGEIEPSRSHSFDTPDVKSIRASLKLSQTDFAAMLGISPATLRNWEQGRRAPAGPAKVLLQVASAHPHVIREVVRPKQRRQRQVVGRVIKPR